MDGPERIALRAVFISVYVFGRLWRRGKCARIVKGHEARHLAAREVTTMRHSGIRVAAAALLTLLTLAVASCAHLPAEGQHPTNIITAEEIERSQSVNAYEAISKIQPNFLVARGPTSISGSDSGLPNVYVDDVPYGPISTLQNIPAADVAMIRMYRAWEATYRFGTGNMGGVIDVFTKH